MILPLLVTALGVLGAAPSALVPEHPAAPAVYALAGSSNAASEEQALSPSPPPSPPPPPPQLRAMSFGPYPPAWQVDIGPGVFATPQFPGSNSLRVLPIPQLEVRYKNQFFASVQTGVGYNLINTRKWRAGPIIRPEFGRTRTDIAVFPGLRSIGVAPELGGFVTYQPTIFTSVQLELRQAVAGHAGFVGDLTVRRVALKGKWTLGYSGRLRFADATYLRAYHGVTPAESITSGLSAYRPGASLTDIGVSGFASRRLGGKWSASAFASYARLLGDAAASPISGSQFGSRNQITLGTSISYRFRFE